MLTKPQRLVSRPNHQRLRQRNPHHAFAAATLRQQLDSCHLCYGPLHCLLPFLLSLLIRTMKQQPRREVHAAPLLALQTQPSQTSPSQMTH
jgi:hypothetical protein